jgi:hypothetical protein
MAEDTEHKFHAFGYRLPRFELRLPILMFAQGSDPARSWQGTCLNLSYEGMGAWFDDVLPTSGVFRVLLQRTPSEVLELDCEIVYREGCYYGMKFRFFAESQKAGLARLVQHFADFF